MTDHKIALRTAKNKLFLGTVITLSMLTMLPLILILLYIVRMGIAAINWDFLTNIPVALGQEGGGVAHAIVGTLILVGIASVLAIPMGIVSGIFLAEIKKSVVASIARLSLEVLQSIPSIVIGIFIYIWIVKPLGHFSAFSGGIALGIMMLPVVSKSTEETLKLIPYHLKEASMALGVPYWKTIIKVILPAGLSGILTGIIIGIARIAGETAPLLFTAFGNEYMETSIFKPVSALPLIIYNYALSPYDSWHSIAWGASFVLVFIVLFLNLSTKLISRRWKVKL